MKTTHAKLAILERAAPALERLLETAYCGRAQPKEER
jgi:hypothetical protein